MTLDWLALAVTLFWSLVAGLAAWELTGRRDDRARTSVLSRVAAFRELGILFGVPVGIAVGGLALSIIVLCLLLAYLQGERFAIFSGLFFIALFGALSPFLPRINRMRYLSKFNQQLPLVADQMVSAVRGGKTLTQGLLGLPDALPHPASQEFAELAERTRLSAGGLEEAARDLTAKIDNKHLALLLSVFTIFSKQGGNLVEPVQKMATSFKEIIRADEVIATAAKNAKMTFYMINGSILFIFIFISLARPQMISQIFENLVTILFFLVGLAIYIAGSVLLYRMSRVDV